MSQDRIHLRVATGTDDDAEVAAALAALVTVLSTPSAATPAPARPGWADHAIRRGAIAHRGPGAWRAAAHPRGTDC